MTEPVQTARRSGVPQLTDHELCILRELGIADNQNRPGMSAGWCATHCKITPTEANVALEKLHEYDYISEDNSRGYSDACYIPTEKGHRRLKRIAEQNSK